MTDNTVNNPAPLEIQLDVGQPAWLVSHSPKHTVIRSVQSFPPGATARGTVQGISSPFELKVRDCRKDGEYFLTEGRTQNATRELNQVLKSARPSTDS